MTSITQRARMNFGMRNGYCRRITKKKKILAENNMWRSPSQKRFSHRGKPMVDIEILGLAHLRFNVDWVITSLALFPVLCYSHGNDFFFPCHNGTFLVATFHRCPLSLHCAQLGTPALCPVTEQSHHHGRPMQSSDSSRPGVWVQDQRDVPARGNSYSSTDLEQLQI